MKTKRELRKLLPHGLEEYEEFNWHGHWECVTPSARVRGPTLTEQVLAE